jgi:hypothetical protein
MLRLWLPTWFISQIAWRDQKLTLPLLVAWIAAHDADHAAPAHNLALITNTLHAGFDFHRSTRLGPKRTRARIRHSGEKAGNA